MNNPRNHTNTQVHAFMLRGGGLIIREEQWEPQPRAQGSGPRCCFPLPASVNYQQHDAGNVLPGSTQGERPLMHGEDPDRLPPLLLEV